MLYLHRRSVPVLHRDLVRTALLLTGMAAILRVSGKQLAVSLMEQHAHSSSNSSSSAEPSLDKLRPALLTLWFDRLLAAACCRNRPTSW